MPTKSLVDLPLENDLEKILGNRICRGIFVLVLYVVSTVFILQNVDVNTPLITHIN